MKIITSVSVCVKNKTRSNIFLDGVFYCSMDNMIVVKHGLKEGVQITEEELESLQKENEFSTAFDKALNYVARYKKTRKQVIDYLVKKGYLYALAVEVVKKLQSYGFVDDRDYATSFVNEKSKNNGKMLIKMQLRAKGVDEKTADNAVGEIEDETPNAIAVAKKYMRSKENNRDNLLKCYRYLLSKGFSFESAKSAIDCLKGGEDDY